MLDRDQALPLLSEFLTGLLDIAEPVGKPESEEVLLVDELNLTLPFEIRTEWDIVDHGSSVMLRAAPSTQTTETTIMPVLHNLSVRMVLEDNPVDILDTGDQDESQ